MASAQDVPATVADMAHMARELSELLDTTYEETFYNIVLEKAKLEAQGSLASGPSGPTSPGSASAGPSGQYAPQDPGSANAGPSGQSAPQDALALVPASVPGVPSDVMNMARQAEASALARAEDLGPNPPTARGSSDQFAGGAAGDSDGEVSVIGGVSDAERSQIVACDNLSELDRNLKQRLYMQFARKAKALPADIACRWAAAKGDRHGLKRLSLLKEWARDPTGFGRGEVSESVSVARRQESESLWGWRSSDQLHAMVAHLPDQGLRASRVEEYIQTARGKRTHPQFKGEFEYRIYLGCNEVERISAARVRDLRVTAEVEGGVGPNLLDAMEADSTGIGRGLVRQTSDEEPAAPKAKAKAKAKKQPRGVSAQEGELAGLLKQSEKALRDMGNCLGRLANHKGDREQAMVALLSPPRTWLCDYVQSLKELRPRINGPQGAWLLDLKVREWEDRYPEAMQHFEEARGVVQELDRIAKRLKRFRDDDGASVQEAVQETHA